ncbi:MAG: barstar family protein [Armatimonas sp.]
MTADSLACHMAQLDKIREEWFSSGRQGLPEDDRKAATILLDGSCISDIPTFYIALGEAVNGPGGYFGGNLDALNDCLRGGFGLATPFTLEVIGLEKVRDALDAEEAWHRAQQNQSEPLPDAPTYFDIVIEIFTECGVAVREYGQKQ